MRQKGRFWWEREGVEIVERASNIIVGPPCAFDISLVFVERKEAEQSSERSISELGLLLLCCAPLPTHSTVLRHFWALSVCLWGLSTAFWLHDSS